MKKKIIATATLMAAAVLVPATPAAAAEPDCSWVFCGVINHDAPDAGFDDPFRIKCHDGRWMTVAEGEGTGRPHGCADIVALRMRPHTQYHCDRAGNPFDSRKVKWSNDTNNRITVRITSNKAWNCTHQRTP